eukprot:scaffold1400_cov137-Cylindrotheca_fusiformis.AAC.6
MPFGASIHEARVVAIIATHVDDWSFVQRNKTPWEWGVIMTPKTGMADGPICPSSSSSTKDAPD